MGDRQAIGHSRRSAKDLEQEIMYGEFVKKQMKFLNHVQEGHLDRVEDLLEFERDELNLDFQEDVKGFTPLMTAATAGNLDMVTVLLEAKADPHIRDKTVMRYTPLEVAIVIMEDEDPEYAEVVEILRKASGYERLPRVRRKPGEDNR